jgi:large subunit ribosomal protein L2
MNLKKKKPCTQSQRHLIQLNFSHLKKKPLLKKEIKGKKNFSGRNAYGKITVRHKGNGHKKKYRKINFKRNYESTGITTSIEYDPNRNAFIASVYDFNRNSFFYILAPKNLKAGDIVKSGINLEAKLGYALPINEIPVGSFLNSVSTKLNKPAELSRSAGTFSRLKEITFNSAKIELSSGEQKFIPSTCYATIGIVSNELYFLKQLGKAGRSRWLNSRPTVRGVAMNPIDHPHGGGEGKKSGQGKTPWGKPVKHGCTSKSKNKIIPHKK